MRLYLILSVVCIIWFSTRGGAQTVVPDGNFETWDSLPGYGLMPDNWLGGNDKVPLNPVFQSTDAHSGSYALGGRVLQVGDSIVPPQIETFAWPNEMGEGELGFPLTGS